MKKPLTDNPQRRKFLKNLTAGTLLCALPSGTGLSETRVPSQKPKVGIQLWTLRQQLEKDPRDTLKRIAEIGFAGVETAFFSAEFSLTKAPHLLKEFGLPVCSAHCEIPAGMQKQAFLEMAKAFQCDRMIWHGWPMDPKYQTVAGTKKLAQIYNEAYDFASSHGLKFGLHNHWWEFEKQQEGHFPYEVLLESLYPEIFFEVDTYWAKAAGQDPAKVVSQLAKRVPLMHIKDGPGDKESPMVAIGTGAQDVKGIVRASQHHVEWLIIEFDSCATDIFVALRESYRYLTQNGLGEGRL